MEVKGVGASTQAKLVDIAWVADRLDVSVRHVRRRVDVATVVGAVGAGDSLEEVQEAYQLSRDQLLAALRYAAHVAAHLPPAVREVS